MREEIGEKGERMLELLAQGSSNRDVASRMGYQEGTMRVYLHNLYRKIGVGNKTEAVIWYLKRQERHSSPAAAAAPVAVAHDADTGDLFGDMALREDLYTALGVMSSFVGPYGRVWELGLRLKGGELDAPGQARRERARGLWRALLRGDWAHAKRVHDAEQGTAVGLESPSDSVLLATMLIAGGYSGAADRLVSRLTQKRKSGSEASARETLLMRGAREAFEGRDAESSAKLQALAQEKSTPALVKQVALALLFHAHAARRESAKARVSANALWTEAEAAKQQLIAMGERPFGQAARTAPAKRAPVREKATAR
jgi:DNA-binding CsgD family transcriptional regulator